MLKAGLTSKLEQVLQGPVQSSFEKLQRHRFWYPLGNLFLCFSTLMAKISHVHLEFCLLQPLTTASSSFYGHLWKMVGPIFTVIPI